MYRNAVYICISWHSKICWFPLKKCWYQQISKVVSCNSYFFIPKEVIAVPSFIISWYVWQIIGMGAFLPLLPWASMKGPYWIGLRLIFSCFWFLVEYWKRIRLNMQLLDFTSESEWKTMNEGLIMGVPKEL